MSEQAQSSGHEKELIIRGGPNGRCCVCGWKCSRTGKCDEEFAAHLASVAQPKSSGHEWIPRGFTGYGHCTCGEPKQKDLYLTPEQWQAHVASVAQPKSSGHEWIAPSAVIGDCGGCTCGWRGKYGGGWNEWDQHLASVAQAAQPPYDDRDQSTVSAFEKWWLALANSDDPIVDELDSLNLSQQATVVTFCKRAFAAAQPQEVPCLCGKTFGYCPLHGTQSVSSAQPQEVPAEPPCHVCGAWLCSHLDDAAQPQEVPAEQRAAVTIHNAIGFSKHIQGMCVDEEPHEAIRKDVIRLIEMLHELAAQPASAAKPAEDGLEAQCLEFAQLFFHQWIDLVRDYQPLMKPEQFHNGLKRAMVPFIRTHQAARERELWARAEEMFCKILIGKLPAMAADDCDSVAHALDTHDEARERELRDKLEGLGWQHTSVMIDREGQYHLREHKQGFDSECHLCELRALLASHWPAQKPHD